jgi:N-acyl-D-amino-acid deacylase
MDDSFHTLIRSATLLDGTGAPARRADVGIRDDCIAAIGDLSKADAGQMVDAAGLTLAPGFIDAHSHSDAFILLGPDAPSKVTQGVTTEVVGQCGTSAAPLFGRNHFASDWASFVYPRLMQARAKRLGGQAGAPVKCLAVQPPDGRTGATWASVADYCALFDQVRPAINAVLLAGHNTLRAGVIGYEPRAATPDDVRAMQRRLEQAMDEGCSGMSTGLIYQPGRHSTPEEVAALAGTVAARGGFYATHMRNEGDTLIESLDEVLQLARRTGVRVQISHLKTSQERNWAKLDAVLARIEAARGEGHAVHADRYPYVAGGTGLDVVLPSWIANGGHAAVMSRISDAATRARLAADLDAGRPRGAWDGVMVGGTTAAELLPLRGKTIAEIATARGCSAGEAVAWILYADELRTEAFFFGMSEKNLRRIYAQPWVMVGSDASIRAPEGVLSMDHPHPRAYGTFPRFLRLVQDEKLMTLPEAIRRITSLPADAFGLQGRGRIAEGAFADLVLFDPAAMRDRATFAQPHQLSEGVRQVWVNGRCCFTGGHFTGARGGRVLQSRF